MGFVSDAYDVVVVGGGVAGCAAAYRLAPDTDVALVEKGQVASEASGLAAGLVAPTLFYADHPDVARHANDWFRTFDGTGNFTYHQSPRIEFVRPDSEADARERADALSADGFPVSFLEPDAVSDRYPWFDPSAFAGVVEYGDTGWVDPYEYTVALKNAAEARGVDLVTRTPVTGFRHDGDAVTGIETEDGSIAADSVVVAAGWRTADLVADYADLPVRPFRLQCAVLQPGTPLDEAFPLGRVARDDLYFRREINGNLLVGGGEYFEDDPESVVPSVDTDEEFRQHVASTLPTFLADSSQLAFADGWAGVDGATPDTFPIVDSPHPGLVVATGFNGLGMVGSPIAAEGVHALVTDAEGAFPLEPFALDRFPDGDIDFDLRGTFEMAGAGR